MLKKVSAYCTAYNLEKCRIPFRKNLQRLDSQFEEVVVCVNTDPSSPDNSLDLMTKFVRANLKRTKIIKTNLSFSSNLIDGQTKQAANAACGNELRCLFDLDEFIPNSNFPYWRKFLDFFQWLPVECLAIPVIDLYGSYETVRKNNQIAFKFRVNKSSAMRGPIKQAVLPDGKINLDISDTTEPIDENGNLVKFTHITDYSLYIDNLPLLEKLEIPFVVHEGHADFSYRENINKFYWEEHWSTFRGKKENVKSLEEMMREEVVPHNLNIQ